jgi:hypothetical protein
MIHGEHYVARISPETAQAAARQRPWSREVANEVINFLAKFIGTNVAITKTAKDLLENHNLSTCDLFSVMETGIVWGAPEKTSRKDYYKYTIIGHTLDDDTSQIKVVVIPNHLNASISILSVQVVEVRNV